MSWYSTARPPWRALVVGVISLVPWSPCRAQLRFGWEASATAAQFARRSVEPLGDAALDLPASRWLGQHTVGAVARFDRPLAQFSAHGLLRGGDVGSRVTGGFSGLAGTPAWNGFRLNATSDVAHVPNDGFRRARGPDTLLALYAPIPPQPTWRATSELHVAYARGRSGVWAGVADRQGRMSGDSLAARSIVAGLFHQMGDVDVSVSMGSETARLGVRPSTVRTSGRWEVRRDSATGRSDSTYKETTTGDSGSTGSLKRLSEVAARLGWGRGRFAFDAVVNARPQVAGYASAVWGEAVATAAVASRLTVVGSLRTGAPVPGTPQAARRSVSLELRVAPAPLWRPTSPKPIRSVANSFDLQQTATGTYVLTLRVPNARTVELAGDFTGWKPVSLRQVDASRWEIAVAVAPGAHRCNVRIDGAEWVPPPSVPAVDDEFNGRVGLFVVN